MYGFIGPNGSGKTTTIAMCLGLLHPSAGTVRILGRAVTPRDTRALRAVGSLLGAPGMVPSLSGRDNLRLPARLYPSVDGARVEEVLDFVGLSSAAGRKVKGYSLGNGPTAGTGGRGVSRDTFLWAKFASLVGPAALLIAAYTPAFMAAATLMFRDQDVTGRSAGTAASASGSPERGQPASRLKAQKVTAWSTAPRIAREPTALLRTAQSNPVAIRYRIASMR